MNLILDKRNKHDIYSHLLYLAPYYVPEWNVSLEGDLGLALLKIYAEIFAETLERFNRMPYKNFIYFLNILGAEMLPATPSEGYLTVRTSAGEQGTFAAERTRVYATDANGEKILFELQNGLRVTDNDIGDIYCKSNNTIVCAIPSENQSLPEITLFDFYRAENLQKQRLIAASSHVLNTKGRSLVSVTVVNSENPFAEDNTARLFADPDLCEWQYLSHEGWKTVCAIEHAGGTFNLYIDGEIPLAEFNGIKSRWLQCIIDNSTGEDARLTGLRLSAKAKDISADWLCNNDLHLPFGNFPPFGERFARFDCFYVGCEEAFTKKGAHISVEFSIGYRKTLSAQNRREINWKPVLPASELNEPEEVRIYIEEVVWEYWNGSGWARLFDDNSYGDVFKRGVKEAIEFICPNDIAPTFAGGKESYYIRARIDKQSDVFTFDAMYVSPVVESVRIGYDYRNVLQDTEYLFIEKDLCLLRADGQTEIRPTGEHEHLPAAYFALERPFAPGVASIYFRNFADLENPPAVKFEYYGSINGRQCWIEPAVLDETHSFAESGLVTLICREKFEKLMLFSKEKYWFRAINTDGRYTNLDVMRPRLSGIHLNTVKIKQSETMEPEYFSIEYGQKNKICRLRRGNIISEAVYVNELSETPVYEITPEIESEGKWVKWERAESLSGKTPDDRAYILDPVEGVITFGNGKKGRIPSSGETETIMVEYSVCAGERGNLGALAIEGFADSVPFVSEMFNAEPISGGCGAESAERAVSRNARYIRHLDRAVSISDIETIAASADRSIMRVKAVRTEGGATVALLPKQMNATGLSGIKKRVAAEFEKRAPAVLSSAGKIDVIEVCYIEFSVSVSAGIYDLRNYQEANKELERRLTEFLDPVTGNFDGKGFEIGVLPTKQQIINYLNAANAARIDRLHIYYSERLKEARKETDFEKADRNPYAVPLSGVHQIKIMPME